MIAAKSVKIEIRTIKYLLKKYETKQPGEVNPKTIDLKKEGTHG